MSEAAEITTDMILDALAVVRSRVTLDDNAFFAIVEGYADVNKYDQLMATVANIGLWAIAQLGDPNEILDLFIEEAVVEESIT